jgi:pyridoxine 5-phosphate synthase
VGADRVELYTESYAKAWSTPEKNKVLSQFAQTSRATAGLNLGVNAGHDLNRDNLTEFLRAVPGVLEVSIGHALIADALEMGYVAAVKAYLHCIDEAFAPAATAG